MTRCAVCLPIHRRITPGLQASKTLRLARQVIQRAIDRFEAAMQTARIERIVGR